MKTLTTFINPFPMNAPLTEKYEVIENEVLEGNDFKGLNVSGSLFSLTTFRGVTFQSCVFFGSRIENCEFINCRFEDCSFQFTALEHCNFKSSTFAECKWDKSPIKKALFNYCNLDMKTSYYASKEDNKFEGCFSDDDGRDWTVKFRSGKNRKVAA